MESGDPDAVLERVVEYFHDVVTLSVPVTRSPLSPIWYSSLMLASQPPYKERPRTAPNHGRALTRALTFKKPSCP